MAIYYLGMKTFSRGAGKSGSRATSGAAYRAGERIRDERTGAVYDHRRRKDVLHREIVLPARAAARGAAFDWARDRSMLWNAAERAETRRNARVAREFTVALPHELSPAGRTALTQRFAQQIADRYGSVVDVAIHAPRGDPRNFHAHLLATTREVTPEGLGRKTALELTGTERHHLGLPRWRDELTLLGERWVVLANAALQREHSEARIRPRDRAERAREPSGPPRLPPAAYHMERRGERSFVAERIREAYQARLQSIAKQSQLQRLGAGAQAAWQAMRSSVRERMTPARAAIELARKDAPRVAERDSARTVERSRVREVRRSWLAEKERAWRRFLEPHAPGRNAAKSLTVGVGESRKRPELEREQERRRSRDYGMEL
jgi:hypothetical protein